MKIVFILFAVLLGHPTMAAVDFSFSPKNYRTDIEKQRFLFVDLVMAEQFEQAQNKIDSAIVNVKKSPEEIGYIYLQLVAFSPEVDGLGKKINQWLLEAPESADAHLVKAIWLLNKAWQVRGRKYATDTKEDNLETFRLLVTEAANYVDNARDLAPNNILIPIFAIRTCIPRGQACFIEQADIILSRPFQERISHWFMLNFLQPKWFGSDETLHAYLDYLKTNDFFTKYPSLAPLQGILSYYQSTKPGIKHQAALSLLKKARSFGENPNYLSEAIRHAYRLDDYAQVEKLSALRDQLFPLSKEQEEKKNYWAWALKKQMVDRYNADDYQAAYDLATQVLASYPLSKKALSYQAYAALKLGDKKTYQDNFYLLVKAFPKEISYAITLDHAWLLDQRYDDVIAMWQRFIKIIPNSGHAHLQLAGTYKHKGDMQKAREHLDKGCQLGEKKACDILKRFQ